jgi:hypothetical protein
VVDHQVRIPATRWLNPSCEHLCLSYEIRRQSISYSYGFVDTSRRSDKQGIFTMTMLTPAHGQFERTIYSPVSGNRIEAGRASMRLAKLKRFCISAFWVMMACVALTAIMALKVIVYLPHFHA